MLATRRIHRPAIACALAFALLAAPAAARPLSQDLRNPDTRDLANAQAQERYLMSYGDGSTAPAQDLRSPDARDAAAGRGTFSAPETVVVKLREPAPAPEGGIDWGDVGVGAGSLLGLILLGFAGSATVIHRRRRSRSPVATTA